VSPVALAAPGWFEVSDAEQHVIVFAKGMQFKSAKVKTSEQYAMIELYGVTTLNFVLSCFRPGRRS
jgi:hypothetical protein